MRISDWSSDVCSSDLHPQVCKFDLAYMEAATGRRVHPVECMIRGGQVCRFKLGAPPARGLGSAKAGSRDDGRFPRRWREDSLGVRTSAGGGRRVSSRGATDVRRIGKKQNNSILNEK